MFSFSSGCSSARGGVRLRNALLCGEHLEARMVLSNVQFAAINMTPYEQLMLELVNRAREDPNAEAARYGIGLNDDLPDDTISPNSKQPLAPNTQLLRAARDHSQDMLDRDYFSHNSPAPGSTTPRDRVEAAGYTNWISLGENIAMRGTTGNLNRVAEISARHEALFRSSGHRENILGGGFRELGAGIRFGDFQGYNSIMVTENFGARSVNYFVTGVAFTDEVQDNDFYNVGEQMEGVTIVAENSAGDTFTTTTGTSGGYALRVPNGTYMVTASGGGFDSPLVFTNIVVSGANEKVDFTPGETPPPPPPSPSPGEPPAVIVAGPDQAVRFELLTFVFSTDQPGASGQYAYTVDWGDGSTVQTFSGSASGIVATHLFSQLGALNVQADAAPSGGDAGGPTSHSVDVVPYYFEGDDLIVGATGGDDQLHFYLIEPGRFNYSLNGAYETNLDVAGSITAYGGYGGDRISIDAGARNTVIFHGGAGNDRLYGGRGDDQLLGEAGRDYLAAGYGNDLVDGGAGNDVLRGQDGDDLLFGDDGNDHLMGDRGDDILRGGAGRDLLRGGGGNDVLLGGAHNDRLYGQFGRNLLVGGGGRDRLEAGRGPGILIGGDLSYQANDHALEVVLDEWAFPRAVSQKIANLLHGANSNRANENFFLELGVTVLEDGQWDYLYGGDAVDLLLIAERRDLIRNDVSGDHVERY